MYIYKGSCGVRLSVEEFIEILEQDLLDELIAIVSCLDDPILSLEGMLLDEETEEERVNRIMKRLLASEEGQ